MKVFDKECPNGHVNEYFVHDKDEQVLCKQCGEVCTKTLLTATNFSLDGTDYAFPTAAMKWDKRHSLEAVQKKKQRQQEV